MKLVSFWTRSEWHFLGRFQSGQMGGTVNPLATLSWVQIPLCPPFFCFKLYAQVVELVDTPVLEAGIFGCESSSLSLGTNQILLYFWFVLGEQINKKDHENLNPSRNKSNKNILFMRSWIQLWNFFKRRRKSGNLCIMSSFLYWRTKNLENRCCW